MNSEYHHTVKDHFTSKYPTHTHEFIEELIREKNKLLVFAFISTLRYINDYHRLSIVTLILTLTRYIAVNLK